MLWHSHMFGILQLFPKQIALAYSKIHSLWCFYKPNSEMSCKKYIALRMCFQYVLFDYIYTSVQGKFMEWISHR